MNCHFICSGGADVDFPPAVGIGSDETRTGAAPVLRRESDRILLIGTDPDTLRSITALIANNYGEMMSVPLYDSALLFSALVLLVIVFIFNAGARLIMIGINRRQNGG